MPREEKPKTIQDGWEIIDSNEIVKGIRYAFGSRCDSNTHFRVVDSKHCIPDHDRGVKAIEDILQILRLDCPEFFHYKREKADCDDRQAIINGRGHEHSLMIKSPYSFSFGMLDGGTPVYPGITEPHAVMWALTTKGYFIVEPADGSIHNMNTDGGRIWEVHIG